MREIANSFLLNNQPLELSTSQAEIFQTILFCKHPRVQVIAPTQYGKSLTVATATLLRAIVRKERFTIMAPSEKKAMIIMNYIIDHVFDRRDFLEQLELDKSETLDRLRRERSRNRLIFKGGGGVMTLSLDARNSKRSFESAMGFGGNRIILDESSLIDDQLYATVKRMLGGYPYKDTFLLEIGNPFHRNHFYRTWHSDRYQKIFIDYHIGLKEGRYSPEFIEEMREEAFFDIFYECLFPDEDVIDEHGYRRLVTLSNLDKIWVDHAPSTEYELRLGVDIAGGGDKNVYVLRSPDMAWVESTNQSSDTMSNVQEVQRILEAYPTLAPERVFIDDIGIGRGVSDRLKELSLSVIPVTAGAKPVQTTKYKNVKAENYWLLKQWLHAGGTLAKHDRFKELTEIKYKVSTDKVLQIEPKDELKKRLGRSPDFAEALMLTFTPDPPQPNIRWI